ncbi:uncharacterized protein LOC113791570 [Dermatophagoides pteronyssinus]|uniref:uncharacterized protein LOC113791570 n=1 Tax=Dermatophagoides pteronyssinus TaxID=6956 RepID=UPI003F66688D
MVTSLFCFTVILMMTNGLESTSSYDEKYYQPGFAMDNIVSRCDFSINSCRFRNQHNLALYNRYFNANKLFFDRHSLLLLNINSQRSQQYPGARLITPYYQAKYRNACLFISYRYNGPGFLRFFIIQQDNDNRCIYSYDCSKLFISSSSTNIIQENKWNSLELQLNLNEGDVRFFLETHFNSTNKSGYFAIGDFNFGYGYCQNKNENHCYDNIVNRHINVAPTAN